MPSLTRRRFLAGTAALVGTGSFAKSAGGKPTMNAKITRIESIPISYPTAGRFKFFEGPSGEPLGRQSAVVKITAADGTVGWGQSVPSNKWSYETLESVHSTITRYLAPVLVGLDAFDMDTIEKAMNTYIAPAFSTGQPICKAGVDLALFDLTGKLLKQTPAQRWERRGKDQVTLSWTLNPRKLDDIPGLIKQGRQRGYRNFNVKVAPDPKFDLEMCRMVKQFVPDGFLWADANGGYDETTALQVAPQLADAGVDVFEQPIRPNRISGFQKLRKQGSLPIIMDEGVVSAVELEEFIKLGMCDGVAMKLARCGGLTEARRQIELLARYDLMFLGSGLTDPDLSLAATLALYGAYDLKYPAALNGPQFLAASVLKTPLEPIDGTLAVPAGSGLGVEVDETLLEKYRIRL